MQDNTSVQTASRPPNPLLDFSGMPRFADDMAKAGVQKVKVTSVIEVSPVTTPLTRAVNQSSDWLAAMNHRFIKTTLTEAATEGKSSNIHGYNPVPAYAYGAEMGHGKEGRY